MPLSDQFLGEVGDDPLGAPIELRWTAFRERCDLGDFHGYTSSNERSIDKGRAARWPARPVAVPVGHSRRLGERDPQKMRARKCQKSMPPPGGSAGAASFFGFSATSASVVIRSAATEAASLSAVRTTFAGSITPTPTRS